MTLMTATYDNARNLIKNGDIILVYRGGKGAMKLFHALVNFFTGSPVYHTVVAMWMTSPSGTQKLMAIETNLIGGKRIVPLSIYSHLHLQVIPLPSIAKFDPIEEKGMARIGQQMYGFLDLIMIGMHEFFGLKLGDLRGQVCSELTSELWIEAGIPLLDTHISPGRLKLDLQKLGYVPTINVLPE